MTPRTRALLDEQRRLIEFVPPSLVRDLLEVALRAIASLTRGLQRLGGSSYATRLTRTRLAQARALVSVIAERYGDEVADVVERTHGLGAEDGRRVVNAQIEALVADGVLPDGTPPATTDNAGALLDEGLIDIKEASRKAYSDELRKDMHASLALAAQTGETLSETSERMSKDLPITPARAERIVRTEHAYALGRRQLDDFRSVMGDEIGAWRKQLVATLDDRTGADSIFVNGQTRRIDEPFRDNIGNVYMMPPNRPNDREVVIFVPAATVRATLKPDPAATPRGEPRRPAQADIDGRRPIRRENEAATAMRRAGYDVEHNHTPNSAGKTPDYLIDGHEFDGYSPEGRRARNVWGVLKEKIEAGQAQRFVVNLADYGGSVDELKAQFRDHPMEGLEEVFAVNKDGSIFRLFP